MLEVLHLCDHTTIKPSGYGPTIATCLSSDQSTGQLKSKLIYNENIFIDHNSMFILHNYICNAMNYLLMGAMYNLKH